MQTMRRLVIGVAVIYLAALFFTVRDVARTAGTRRLAGWSYVPGSRDKVGRVAPYIQGLQPGDIVVTLRGQPPQDPENPKWRLMGLAPGDRYKLEVRRGDRIIPLELKVRGEPQPSFTPGMWLNIFQSLTFAICGLIFGWQRPDLATARAGWLASQLTALFFLRLAGTTTFYSLGWDATWTMVGLSYLWSWHQWAIVRFIAIFPARPANYHRWAWITHVTFGLSCLLSIQALLVFIPLFPWVNSPRIIPDTSIPNLVVVVWFCISTAFHLVNGYRQAIDRADRKRIEWVAGSILMAVGFSTAFVVAGQIMALPQNSGDIANLGALAVPFCFWYAIVKHKVLDLRVVIRASLQYLLAVQLLRALTLAPIALIALYWYRHPAAPVASGANLAGLGVMAFAGFSLEFRQKILARLDRRFFREQLDREQMLRDLARELAHKGSWEEIVRTIQLSLEEIFHPTFTAVQDTTPDADSALTFPLSPPEASEQTWLVVGPRRSEEPYTAAERESLALIASQLRLVRQNLLQAEARFEAVLGERARIARELHDTMSQGFSGISIYLQAAQLIMEESPEEAGTYLEEARALAKQSSHDVRASVRNLRETSDDQNLVSRLRNLAARTPSGAGVVAPLVTADLDESAAARATPDIAWQFTRIAEEALTNAFKYAEATEIRIALNGRNARGSTTLELSVADNGKGFDIEAAGERGFGLIGMKERLEPLQGALNIRSSPGLGTTIIATVTLPSTS